MSKLIDLTGETFGKLKVLKRGENKGHQTYWTCQCECGTIKDVRGTHLRNGLIISCGCEGKKNLVQKIDLIGQKFGRLTVIKEAEERASNGQMMWVCKCECGKEVTVKSQSLREGKTKSCGCLQKEIASKLGSSTMIDLTNKRFGKLTALYPTEKREHQCVVWHCQCDCGEFKDVSSDHLQRGLVSSCGCLGRSLGEETIKQILDKNNIIYKTQVTFKDCINPKTNTLLKFDFYIDDKYLIEFDGQQHYNTTGGWNNNEHFEQVQFRDDIKNKWCKQNNIPLIRIPYWHLKELSLNDLLLESTSFLIN